MIYFTTFKITKRINSCFANKRVNVNGRMEEQKRQT